jgi:hypothetical protein
MVVFWKQSFTSRQTPASQIPLAHTAAHLPQFLGSVCMLTHPPVQAVCPAVAQPQTPAEQVAPGPQATPQPVVPQWAGSVCRSAGARHTAPQRVLPVGH